MSEKLEPGRLVRWQHDGGWKVGRTLYWADSSYVEGLDDVYIVQCPEGIYAVDEGELEPHPTRKERGEV